MKVSVGKDHYLDIIHHYKDNSYVITQVPKETSANYQSYWHKLSDTAKLELFIKFNTRFREIVDVNIYAELFMLLAKYPEYTNDSVLCNNICKLFVQHLPNEFYENFIEFLTKLDRSHPLKTSCTVVYEVTMHIYSHHGNYNEFLNSIEDVTSDYKHIFYYEGAKYVEKSINHKNFTKACEMCVYNFTKPKVNLYSVYIPDGV